MQLLSSNDAYYINSGCSILKCCRITSNLSVFDVQDLPLDDFILIGNVFCYIGKIELNEVSYLIFVQECTEVTKIGHNDSPVWKIDKVCYLPLTIDEQGDQTEISLHTHQNRFKSFGKLVPSKFYKANANNLIDDLIAFFNFSTTFYFSTEYDITKTLQNCAINSSKYDADYFWNRNLLKDFFVADGSVIPAFKKWTVPIIYGHIDQKSLSIEGTKILLILISRRSNRRAGLRYLRRGIDENGHVANFVETEFIISVFGHSLSYVQCRGSIPIYWSQRATYHLRPSPTVDFSLAQSMPAFKKHIDMLEKQYGSPLLLLNLIDSEGKESGLGESYLQHVTELSSTNIFYISFDFHRICGVRKISEVTKLVKSLECQIKKIGFTWIDKTGIIVLKQNGIIRTNCIDCLDRTNVVQGAISQTICINQCRKLGLIEPLNKAPEKIADLLNEMWATHGDTISRQYAGTNALKGDITRNPNLRRRKFTGIMKDGFNSASRYYMSHFSDSRKQSIIDILLTN